MALSPGTHPGSNLCPVSLFYFSRNVSISWPVGHVLASLTFPPNAHVHLNPLSPNGVQHQYSPNTIHTLLRD